MNLRLELLPGEDVPVVAVHGELDIEGAPELRRALIEAIDAHSGQRVIVDLEVVDFIDSAGLGVLLGGLERARGAGGDLTTRCDGSGRHQGARAHRPHPRLRDPAVAVVRQNRRCGAVPRA
jgi:anti-sigma B factor antagonist